MIAVEMSTIQVFNSYDDVGNLLYSTHCDLYSLPVNVNLSPVVVLVLLLHRKMRKKLCDLLKVL